MESWQVFTVITGALIICNIRCGTLIFFTSTNLSKKKRTYFFCLLRLYKIQETIHTFGTFKSSSWLLHISVITISCYFQVLAVKKINFSAFPGHPSDLFIELVANISRLNHPSLSELVGYCSEHGQCLLAYEFYRNGSLKDLLHLVDDQSQPLSWNSRVKIALGSARALE